MGTIELSVNAKISWWALIAVWLLILSSEDSPAAVKGPKRLSEVSQPPRKKIVRLNVIKVEGKIRKPQAFYVLQRSSVDFDDLQLDKSFIPKIYESLHEKPFE